MTCLVCQCTFGSGGCVSFLGRGTGDDPYTPHLITHPEGLATCTSAGLGVFLPPPLDDPPSVFIGTTVSQFVPASTTQIIFFPAVLYDTDGMYSPERSSRITFNAPGLYQVTLGLFANARPDQSNAIDIRRNTFELLGRVNGRGIQGPLVICEEFQAGDYVEALVTNNSPTIGLDVRSSVSGDEIFLSYFSAQYLRSL